MSTTNPIIAFQSISEKVTELAAELNFLEQNLKADQIALLNDAHKLLGRVFDKMASSNAGSMFGGVLQMIAPFWGVPEKQKVLSGMVNWSKSLADMYGAFQQNGKTVRELNITLINKHIDKIGNSENSLQQTLQKVLNLSDSIIQSLGQVYSRAVPAA